MKLPTALTTDMNESLIGIVYCAPSILHSPLDPDSSLHWRYPIHPKLEILGPLPLNFKIVI